MHSDLERVYKIKVNGVIKKQENAMQKVLQLKMQISGAI